MNETTTLPEAIRVRAMRPDDVESVVRVHMEAFPGFFLSSLGPGFLRLFYTAVLDDEHGIALVAEDRHSVAGFVCGSTAPQGFYRRVLASQWWKFGWASISAMVCRPSAIPHLLGAVRARVAPREDSPSAELMSVATAPQAQRKGIGEELVVRFLAEARRLGAFRVTLTTDRHANEHVNAFYRRLGFTLATSFVTNTGREMNLYEMNTLSISTVR
jgi:ribosomal protein S18 acetylase RimI-like enzyme